MQSADGRDEVSLTDVGTAKIGWVGRIILKEARWVESVSSLAYCRKNVRTLLDVGTQVHRVGHNASPD